MTTSILGYLETEYLELPYLQPAASAGFANQFSGAHIKPLGLELFALSGTTKSSAVQFKISTVSHVSCPGDDGYLQASYLETPYLAPYLCAAIGVQLDVQILQGNAVQLTVVNYNTNRIRVLFDIKSRGTVNTNWSSNSTLPSTTNSFDVNNLNTDIEEQVFRSNNTTTGIALVCDAGSGINVFLDTFVMTNHNLTSSAIVTLIGDNNPAFSSPGINLTFTMTENRFVYIADDFPLSGFRYWRLNIDDNTNSNPFIEIGVIGFGSSALFNQNCFSDQIFQKETDYKDSVFTEGFTNVENERTVKGSLGLAFKSIQYNSQDYKTLETIIDSVKTTLKSFWIPDPQEPLRFLKFSKLKEIPAQRHNYKGPDADYVDLNIQLDESL